MNRSPLLIATWNARSLHHKTDELLHLLDNENLDVLLITGMWLSSTIDLQVLGYQTHKRDWFDRDGNSVAILIRDSIQHQNKGIPDLDLVEAVAITIAGETNPITLIGTYIPLYRRLLTQDLEAIRDLDPQLLWGGHFNVTHQVWDCPTTNRRGPQFHTYTYTHQLII
ncbi:hypothetical protein PR048_033460 [Dryococelus australis]|uniref:Endonuclease/exonuclease/phosphatase domain-containing protein n=1 Tax=Dryococelus australis TaxID=614101 RepID=A0ABQ9G1L1_9NEOP|nr:hypothetical protein PR048_033460 [Dryococelus australis]